MSLTIGLVLALVVASFVLAVMKIAGKSGPLTEVAVMLLALAVAVSGWN